MGKHDASSDRRAGLEAEQSVDDRFDDSAKPGGPRGRHFAEGAALSRRKVFGILGAGAVVSACGSTVAPKAVEGLSSAADALGLREGPGPSRSLDEERGGLLASSETVGTARASSGGGAMSGGGNGNGMSPDYPPSTASQGTLGTTPPPLSSGPGLTQPTTPLTLDESLHLARRATWGPTPETVAAIRTMGGTAWLDQQLKPESIADTAMDSFLRRYSSLGANLAEMTALSKKYEDTDYFFGHHEVQKAIAARALWSKRQLFEVMVDFHNDRLHLPAMFDKTRNVLNSYDADVIRKYTFGKFSDMVWAMVMSPGMQKYLDNYENTNKTGNQNLGRELLELHTLGVDAGYTQADVEGASKLLTGFYLDENNQKVAYAASLHSFGSVRVFGKTYANAPGSDGLATLKQFVYDLSTHPKAAFYYCADLCRRFVSDAPPKALVERLAEVYLENDTLIPPVVKALLTSPEFKASVGQKYRRPQESLFATARILGLSPSGDSETVNKSLTYLLYSLRDMGHGPLDHTAPDGFADFARPWLSTVGTLARWNMQMSLAGGWLDGLSKPNISTAISKSATYGEAVNALGEWLLLQKLKPTELAAILKFLGKSAAEPLTDRARENEYNLRVRVPALILGAPQHQLR